jgi:hypothetical protein
VFEDYRRYVGEAPSERIVRLWLIAGSRWQRNLGEMVVKNITVGSEEGSVCERSYLRKGVYGWVRGE